MIENIGVSKILRYLDIDIAPLNRKSEEKSYYKKGEGYSTDNNRIRLDNIYLISY